MAETARRVMTFICLLRAVNLPGYKAIAMSDLRAFLTRLGLHDVRSVLQSGNVVFRSAGRTASALEIWLEAEAARKLRLETTFYVRTADEWSAAIARNPFRSEAKSNPSRLVVMFLKHAPAAADVAELQAAIPGRETVRAHGREAYIVYPDGIGRSRLTTRLIERKLRTSGTGRNWNTILKLADYAI